MARLIGFLEAVHFYFHAHALRDPSLTSGPAVILRDGKVLDCSPDLDAAGALSRPNPAYLRIAYPDLREVAFDADACASPYEALWAQVVPDAVAVEPLDCAQGFFEPVRAPSLDVLRDQISAFRDRARTATAGLEVRIGLAPSRMLARVAAHGEHIVLPGREHAFLERAPLEWLPIARVCVPAGGVISRAPDWFAGIASIMVELLTTTTDPVSSASPASPSFRAARSSIISSPTSRAGS